MTRDEHLAWCRGRALACLNRGDLVGAVWSLASDLSKHEDTHVHRFNSVLLFDAMLAAVLGDADSVRNSIGKFR